MTEECVCSYDRHKSCPVHFPVRAPPNSLNENEEEESFCCPGCFSWLKRGCRSVRRYWRERTEPLTMEECLANQDWIKKEDVLNAAGYTSPLETKSWVDAEVAGNILWDAWYKPTLGEADRRSKIRPALPTKAEWRQVLEENPMMLNERQERSSLVAEEPAHRPPILNDIKPDGVPFPYCCPPHIHRFLSYRGESHDPEKRHRNKTNFGSLLEYEKKRLARKYPERVYDPEDWPAKNSKGKGRALEPRERLTREEFNQLPPGAYDVDIDDDLGPPMMSGALPALPALPDLPVLPERAALGSRTRRGQLSRVTETAAAEADDDTPSVPGALPDEPFSWYDDPAWWGANDVLEPWQVNITPSDSERTARRKNRHGWWHSSEVSNDSHPSTSDSGHGSELPLSHWDFSEPPRDRRPYWMRMVHTPRWDKKKEPDIELTRAPWLNEKARQSASEASPNGRSEIQPAGLPAEGMRLKKNWTDPY